MKRSPVKFFLFAILITFLTSCGKQSGAPSGSKSTATTSASGTAKTSTTATTAPKPQATSEQPLALSALSAKDYWVVVGNSGCVTPSCLSIIHTTDGGAHFSKVPVPNFTLGGQLYSIDFISPQDGYFVSAGVGAGYHHQNWYTTNGGSTWNQFHAPEFTITGGGYVYGLVPLGGPGAYSSYTLKRARIGTNSWTTLRTINVSSPSRPSMTAYNASLWISTNSQENPNGSMLFYSSDYGSHFTKLTNPCSIASQCQLYASSPTNIWATYSPLPKNTTNPPGPLTIMRSSDSGANWSLVAKVPTYPSYQVGKVQQVSKTFWVGNSVGIITESKGQLQILQTYGGIAKTNNVEGFAMNARETYYFHQVTFVSPQVGYARVLDASHSSWEVWGTTDGGLKWRKVSWH